VLVVLVGAAWLAVPAFADADPGTVVHDGYLEICKTSSTAVSGTVFSFRVSRVNDSLATDDIGRTVNVYVGQCSPELWVGTGTVKVTEIGADNGDFNTNDYTQVTDIKTIAPGGTNSQLVGSPDLDGRTAWVNVNSGGTSQGTTVVFNDEVVDGYYEICKTQDVGANLDGQFFNYAVEGANGYTASVDVPVGGCSLPNYAPSGHVNIVEDTGSNTYVDDISSPTNSLLSYDLGSASAKLAVGINALGDTQDESIVSYNNNSSLLKICKVVDPDMLPSTYTFNVNGSSYTVNGFSVWDRDSSKVYGCVLAGGFRAGTSVTVTESPKPGEALDHIVFVPSNSSAVSGGNDFTGQSTTFNMQSGTNEVFFINDPAPPQQLKICKTGGASDGSVTYDVSGPVGEAPDVTAGALSVTVPLGSDGSGCALAGMWAYIGPVTVQEEIPEGSGVSNITANGSDANGNRLNTAGTNIPAGTASVWIGAATTIVTYTNGAAAPVAPATSDSSGSGGSGGQSGTVVSNGVSATADTASTSAPTKVTPSKTVKVAATASVASVRIVTIKQGRYVYVRIMGTAKMARIHVTLIGKNHQVLKLMTRYVATNKSARVGNLRLGAKVSAVRIAL
jgi:hypothetical protein